LCTQQSLKNVRLSLRVLVVAEEGLRQLMEGSAPPGLSPPLLLEEYIHHGTCLFKVYVFGDVAEVMVTRPSLHLASDSHRIAQQPEVGGRVAAVAQARGGDVDVDVSMGGMSKGEEDVVVCGSSPPPPTADELANWRPPPDLEIVSRVSAYPRCRSWGKDDLAPRGHGVPPPPEWLYRAISRRLRASLGLHLFNFDLIVPLNPGVGQRGLLLEQGSEDINGNEGGVPGEGGLVYLIDINYFPGIEKLPQYEELMVRFLESLPR
jgi:hypothetical protein